MIGEKDSTSNIHMEYCYSKSHVISTLWELRVQMLLLLLLPRCVNIVAIGWMVHHLDHQPSTQIEQKRTSCIETSDVPLRIRRMSPLLFLSEHPFARSSICHDLCIVIVIPSNTTIRTVVQPVTWVFKMWTIPHYFRIATAMPLATPAFTYAAFSVYKKEKTPHKKEQTERKRGRSSSTDVREKKVYHFMNDKVGAEFPRKVAFCKL